MKKRAMVFGAMAPVVVVGGLQVKSCMDDFSPDYASLFLEMDGKRYGAVSGGGTLSSDRSWPLAQVEVYKDGDEFFVSPDALGLGLVWDAMLNNVTVSAKKEPTHDGYFVQGSEGFHSGQVEIRASETLGVQDTVERITLRNRAGESMEIKTVRNGETAEQSCIGGCEVRTFWAWAYPLPGHSVMAPVDIAVISVSKLATFGAATIVYDRERKVLFVKPEQRTQ